MRFESTIRLKSLGGLRRVPFEGESMHDLRDKIVKCEYRSITPGETRHCATTG